MFFISSSAFWEPGTVLPSYLSGLTASPVLLGLGPALKNAGWMVPQLIVAGLVEGRSRTKGLVVAAGAVGRVAFILMPLLMLSDVPAAAKVWAFLGLYTVFCFAEGVTAVPWTEILGRAVPPRLRGRLLGNMQSMAGLAALGAGVVVRSLLAAPGLAYPRNYAMLFGMASVLLLGSWLMMAAIREPELDAPVETARAQAAGDRRRPRLIENLRSIPRRMRGNPVFRRLLLTRLLCATPNLALPFYVLYGKQVLGLPPVWVGNSVTAQMLGSVLGGLVWARVSYRWGFRPLIRAACVSGLLVPTWTLLAAAAHAAPGLAPLAPLLFLLTYFTIGAYFTSVWVGFTNYLIEIVPVGQRPVYIGILSTVVGPLAFLSAVGGALVTAFGFIPTFALAAAGGLAAMTVAWRLPPEGSVAAASDAAPPAAASEAV
jgi:MFS family permease